MEDRYGVYKNGYKSMRNEEFQEEDVWAVFKERGNFNSKVVGKYDSESSSITPRKLPSAARMIPKANNNDNNSNSQEPKLVQQSVPVNIPDWSKIYRKDSKKSSWLDEGHDEDDDDDDDDDDDSDGNMMPPHEWIARKHARSQVSSFSVCEGAGRTLKGRDLSRVRNAVLTRTGFLE